MPMFEYICKDCGNRFEELRKANEADLPLECPRCKSKNTKKLISLFGTSFSSTNGVSSSPVRKFG
ncbi:FmdB family zinc ribbon protein [Thermovenabulum sp.]|uniref:FmdB family zinc ribbon protein n=1 Tax=Thermovenabulum sp. TaxID=3100335 RepID=UPI003C7AE438